MAQRVLHRHTALDKRTSVFLILFNSNVHELVKTPGTKRRKQLAARNATNSEHFSNTFEPDEDVFSDKQADAGLPQPTNKLQQQFLDSLLKPTDDLSEVTMTAVVIKAEPTLTSATTTTINSDVTAADVEIDADADSTVADTSMVSNETDSSFVTEVSADEEGGQPKRARKAKKQVGRKKGTTKSSVRPKNVIASPIARTDVEKMDVDMPKEAAVTESTTTPIKKTESIPSPPVDQTESSLLPAPTPELDLERYSVPAAISTFATPLPSRIDASAMVSMLATPLTRADDPPSARPTVQKTRSLIATSRTLSTSFAAGSIGMGKLARSTSSFSLVAPDTVTRFSGRPLEPSITEEENVAIEEFFAGPSLFTTRSSEFEEELPGRSSDPQAKKRQSFGEDGAAKQETTVSSSLSALRSPLLPPVTTTTVHTASTTLPNIPFVANNSIDNTDPVTTADLEEIRQEKRLKDMFTPGYEKIKRALSHLRAAPASFPAPTQASSLISTSAILSTSLPLPIAPLSSMQLNLVTNERPAVETPGPASAPEESRIRASFAHAASEESVVEVPVRRSSFSSSSLIGLAIPAKPIVELSVQQQPVEPAGRLSWDCEGRSERRPNDEVAKAKEEAVEVEKAGRMNSTGSRNIEKEEVGSGGMVEEADVEVCILILWLYKLGVNERGIGCRFPFHICRGF
ncbi:hypothetical protein BC938DRAFT_474307 [Jimgerdemannia flammicorona]|uniref:Uncharacterized protein n=1 Tax=Jimgerdemannia flammicorona TaxID=994334 RepID=A0A433Q2H8_9FUNG|nr:hypothetical protein BC938DRAFT_474307 [Jimgerdemannia flammicorona]